MPRREAAAPLLLLAFAVAAAYGLLAWSPFLYDDPQFISGNPKVTGAWPGLRSFFMTAANDQGDFEHLVYLLHRWMYALVGPQALWYRLSSLALHWANAALLYAVYKRCLGDRGLAAGAALLFALYPGHVETLAVSMYKTHLLVAFFCLGILVLSLKDDAPAPWKLGACWLAMGLALLAKETAVMIPPLYLMAAAQLGRLDRRRRTLAWGLAAICAVYALFRLFFLPHRFHPPIEGQWPNHLATSLKCLIWYVSQFPLPWGLCFEHSLSPVRAASFHGMLILAAAALLAAGAWALRRFDGRAWLGFSFMIVALVPFLNLAPFLNFSLVINRYLYLAAAGFFLALARLMQRFLTNRWRSAALAGLVFSYSAVDLRYGVLFATPLDLWSRTAACAPENARARSAFASALLEQGLAPQAIAEYKRAIMLGAPRGGSYGNHSRLAMAYARNGEPDKAAAVMLRFARTRPNAPTLELLGRFLLQAGRPKEALAWLKKAKLMDPSSPTIRLLAARALLDLGLAKDAEKDLRFSLGFPHTRAQALRGMGEACARQGRRGEAIGFYEKAVEAGDYQFYVLKELADLYIKDGRPLHARALYREARKRLAGAARFKPVSAEQSRELADRIQVRAAIYRSDENELFHGKN